MLPKSAHDCFVIIATQALPDLAAVGTVLRHKATGAEVMAICNDDPELVFGIAFETLPTRSDGIAHLLEHLIFRGSHRYPATNLYSSLVQSTLLTGLNASTLADTTLYHLSSGHGQDFANLIDLMMDAVFHPQLRPADILEEREVVVNEMIGHYALPQHQVLERLRAGLLPQTVYAHDWNGTPELVAQLTPDDLHAFHAAHYRADGARIFLWGALDLPRQLDQLNRLLVPSQSPRVAPSVGSEVALRRRSQATQLHTTFRAAKHARPSTGFGWAFDLADADLWQALSLGLFHMPDGALRQLLAVGGSRPIGSGFKADKPFGTFEVAALDHSAKMPKSIEATFQQGLVDLATKGLSQTQTTRFIDRFELDLRNFGRNGRGPQGLRALEMSLGRWRHGADPLNLLNIHARVARLRETLADDPQAMTKLLVRDLIDNPHNVVLYAEPKAGKRPKGQPLDASKKAPCVGAPAIADPTAKTTRIGLPIVDTNGSDFQVSTIAVEQEQNLLLLPSRGAENSTVELALSLTGLRRDQIDLLPLWAAMVADNTDTDSLEIAAQLCTGAQVECPQGAWLFLSGQSLPSQANRLVARLNDAMSFGTQPMDEIAAKIVNLLSRQNAQVAAMGHIFAEMRLRAVASPAGRWDETCNGLASGAALRKLAALDPSVLANALTELAQCLTDAPHRHVAVSGMAPNLAQPLTGTGLHPGQTKPQAPLLTLPLREGIATGASNFTVAQALVLCDNGPARVMAHLLETGWLWDSVRVAGGAYSVRGRFSLGDGLMSLLSIRDPDPFATIDRIKDAPIWLAHNAMDDTLAGAVAATAGHLTRTTRPQERVRIALLRNLCGVTDRQRQDTLDAVRVVDRAAIMRSVDEFEAALPTAKTLILGPAAGLQAALHVRPGAFALDDQNG